MTEKEGSITKHTCGSINREESKLKRPVDDFELFEHTHKNKEEYREKQDCIDSSTSGFDLHLWAQLTGDASKGRIYRVDRSYISGDHSAASVGTPFTGEHAQAVAEAKMEEYRMEMEKYHRKDEEREKELENYRKKDEERDKQMDKIKEESRKMKELLQKKIQEMGLPNYKYPSGSGHGK